MKQLRTAREAALQVLFQQGFQEGKTAQELFFAFADNFSFENRTRDYAKFLVEGIIENQEKIDALISKYSENWRVDRIAVIDKILMQIAIFELCVSTETPTAPKLCIVDILDLAKKYSSTDSNTFINGILDQVYQQEISSKT